MSGFVLWAIACILVEYSYKVSASEVRQRGSAIATIVYDSDGVEGAVALAGALNAVNSTHVRVAFVNKDITARERLLLQRLEWELVVVSCNDCPTLCPLIDVPIDPQKPQDCMKAMMWNRTEFTRILYLSAEILPQEPINYLLRNSFFEEHDSSHDGYFTSEVTEDSVHHAVFAVKDHTEPHKLLDGFLILVPQQKFCRDLRINLERTQMPMSALLSLLAHVNELNATFCMPVCKLTPELGNLLYNELRLLYFCGASPYGVISFNATWGMPHPFLQAGPIYVHLYQRWENAWSMARREAMLAFGDEDSWGLKSSQDVTRSVNDFGILIPPRKGKGKSRRNAKVDDDAVVSGIKAHTEWKWLSRTDEDYEEAGPNPPADADERDDLELVYSVVAERVECTAATTCHGHGRCTEGVGMCLCAPGYLAPDCLRCVGSGPQDEDEDEDAAASVLRRTCPYPEVSDVADGYQLREAGDKLDVVHARVGVFAVLRQDTFVSAALLRYGEWEEFVLQMILPFVPKGGVVIDGGAHLGAFAVAAARTVGTNGRVLAFEPQRVFAMLLRANAQLNGVGGILDIYDSGLGHKNATYQASAFNPASTRNYGGTELTAPEEDENFGIDDLGSVTEDFLYDHGMDKFKGIFLRNKKKKGTNELDDLEDVRIATIDDVVAAAGLGRVDLIKADVEGMELHLLHGGADTIERYQPVIFAEAAGVRDTPPLIRHLDSLGYCSYWFVTPLFNRFNYFDQPIDTFGMRLTVNLLSLPKSRCDKPIRGLKRARAIDRHPFAAAEAQAAQLSPEQTAYFEGALKRHMVGDES